MYYKRSENLPSNYVAWAGGRKARELQGEKGFVGLADVSHQYSRETWVREWQRRAELGVVIPPGLPVLSDVESSLAGAQSRQTLCG